MGVLLLKALAKELYLNQDFQDSRMPRIANIL